MITYTHGLKVVIIYNYIWLVFYGTAAGERFGNVFILLFLTDIEVSNPKKLSAIDVNCLLNIVSYLVSNIRDDGNELGVNTLSLTHSERKWK